MQHPNKRLRTLSRFAYYHKRLDKWQVRCPLCKKWLGTFAHLIDGLINQNACLATHGGLSLVYKTKPVEPLTEPLKPLPKPDKPPTSNLLNDIFNQDTLVTKVSKKQKD